MCLFADNHLAEQLWFSGKAQLQPSGRTFCGIWSGATCQHHCRLPQGLARFWHFSAWGIGDAGKGLFCVFLFVFLVGP